MTENDTTLEQRRERGRQLVAEMLGEDSAEQTIAHWDAISPEFSGYVTEFLAGEIWSRSGLDRRTKSLVSIAALASLGRTRALELNLRFALKNGASRQDIVETLLQIAPYSGFPVTWDALARLDEIEPRTAATS
ncbi:MAG TPA: 4-carboxymuconolactone decarboxylase [Planctomycetaceae bacterium]|nr:4-carboxymuconolactone decarboxylase [Planctomycetaceae bacterium]HCD00032.1 4-carboxymuconolactone decarboxylase [Planctomycetaceae bacterium]|tara:strand:+ start:384 stop:785 length:402 start_codon:yes stop_codon:yes gene_type:complete